MEVARSKTRHDKVENCDCKACKEASIIEVFFASIGYKTVDVTDYSKE